jgi:hypothetical protein
MAVLFFLGSFFTIDMCVGSIVLYLWSKADRVRAHTFAPAVASGLICGDGIWSLPLSILSLLNISPPMCLSPQGLLCGDQLPGRGVPLDAQKPSSHIATLVPFHSKSSIKFAGTN